MDAEAGDDLVEHQRGALVLGDGAQLLQEVLGPQRRMAALHRLHHDSRDVVAVGLDPLQGLRIAVAQHRHVGDGLRRDARRHRQRAGRGTTAGLHQHLVELAVIVVVEDHNALAPGDGPGHAHRRHHGFRAGVAEGDALVARHLRHQCRDLAGQRRLRPDREAFLQLRGDGGGDEVGRMAEHGLAVAVHQVDVFVAVDVPDLRSLGARGQDRIDQLLPLPAEARGGARIGQHRAILLRARLGERHAPVQPAHQLLDIVALGIGERARALGRRRPVEAHARLALIGRYRQRRQCAGRRGRRRGRRASLEGAQLLGEQGVHRLQLRLDEGGERVGRRWGAARHRGGDLRRHRRCGLRCRRCLVGRQEPVEMRREQRHRRYVLQQLPEGDLGLELPLQRARDLAQQKRVEAQRQEVDLGIDVGGARQFLQDRDDVRAQPGVPRGR